MNSEEGQEVFMKVNDDDAKLIEFERVQKLLEPRLESAERTYNQAINGLWLGNTGAALAVLTFVGTTFKMNGSSPKHLLLPLILLPLILFVSGLISLAIGVALKLVRDKQSIERMQGINSIWEIRSADIFSPAETIGLAWKDTRTITALIASFCFVAGCVVGLFVLICIIYRGV